MTACLYFETENQNCESNFVLKAGDDVLSFNIEVCYHILMRTLMMFFLRKQVPIPPGKLKQKLTCSRKRLKKQNAAITSQRANSLSSISL